MPFDPHSLESLAGFGLQLLPSRSPGAVPYAVELGRQQEFYSARRRAARQLDSDRSQEGILCVILRLYSPLEPFFTKEWRPSEIELVP